MSINRTSEFRKVLAEKKVSTPEPHRKRAPKADPGKDVFNKEYLKEGYAVVRNSCLIVDRAGLKHTQSSSMSPP